MSVPSPEDRDDAVAAVLRDLSVTAARSNLVRAGVIEDALRAAERGRLSEPQRVAATAAAHQVAGSAGTFGRPQASRVAAQLEELLTAPALDPVGSAAAGLSEARRRLAELTTLLSESVGHQVEE